MSDPSVRIMLVGADGRLGRRIDALAAARDDLRVTHRIARTDPDPPVSEAGAPPVADVVVDVAGAGGADRAVQLAVRHKIGLLAASTGVSDACEALRRAAAETIPVLLAPNTSVGIAVLRRAVAAAVAALPADWTIDLVEEHHVGKIDRPSGTARALADTVVEAGRSLDPARVHSVRAGGIPGMHEVLLAGPDESIRLRHDAGSRDLFATGALRAALWLAHRAPGLHGMDDVFEA